MLRVGRIFDYEGLDGDKYIDVEIEDFECPQCKHSFVGYVRVPLTRALQRFFIGCKSCKKPETLVKFDLQEGVW